MRAITRLLSLVTLLALVATGAIPQGWMPTQGKDGKLLLVICTGEGAVEQWVDLDPSDPMHDETDRRSECSFAGLFADVHVPNSGALKHLDFPVQLRWAHAELTRRSAGFHARYDARAPPQIS